jgi:DNA-binding MarR family transcriptional regulator
MLNNTDDSEADAAAAEIMDIFVRVLNRAAAIEREPVDIGHGVLLYPSEVHLIDMAGRYPDDGITRIAARLGITKGAVSQMAGKLEEKGYLERVNPEGDRKAVRLRLTERGAEVFEWHRTYHKRVNRTIAGEIAALDQEDIDHLKSVLLQIEQVFERCPDTRKDHTRRFLEGLHQQGASLK